MTNELHEAMMSRRRHLHEEAEVCLGDMEQIVRDLALPYRDCGVGLALLDAVRKWLETRRESDAS